MGNALLSVSHYMCIVVSEVCLSSSCPSVLHVCSLFSDVIKCTHTPFTGVRTHHSLSCSLSCQVYVYTIHCRVHYSPFTVVFTVLSKCTHSPFTVMSNICCVVSFYCCVFVCVSSVTHAILYVPGYKTNPSSTW